MVKRSHVIGAEPFAAGELGAVTSVHYEMVRAPQDRVRAREHLEHQGFALWRNS